MHWFAESLRHHPELAVFLALAAGYAIGRISIAGFKLGAVIGSLIAGVVIGQIGIPVAAELKSIFFLLFLFSIGYKTGPQFFNGLKSSGLPQAGLTVLLCGTVLGAAWAVSRAFGFDPGTAGGLVAGAMTESATVGTAGDAIMRAAVDDATKQAWSTNATVAFAVTYLVGLVTVVTFLSRVAPVLMRVDLAAECRRLEDEMGLEREEAGVVSAYYEVIMRSYEVPADFGERTVGQLEAGFPGQRVFVERVRQGGRIADAQAALRLRPGDHLVLSGRHEALVGEGNPLRRYEVEDRELLDVPMLVVDVVLTDRKVAGRNLGEVARDAAARGVFLRKITRAGQELPIAARTVVNRGDVVSLSGARRHVEPLATAIGWIVRPTSQTDMIPVALAIVVGGLIGLPALTFGPLQLELSLAVGVLLGGLVLGWLSSVERRFGQIPEPALWLFDSLGLTAFIAAVGLSAGPAFVQGLQQSGLALVAAGLIVALMPHVVTVLVGRYVLRMHPGIVLGVCCGAGTTGPSLAAVQEVAKSKIPTLGYGVSYAVGNVLLALWGAVIVLLTVPHA